MENIKAIIFDMDGVLLDSESISDGTWITACKEFKIDFSEEVLNNCRGLNKNDTIQYLKSVYGENFDAAAYLKRTSELFMEVEETKGIALMPYVVETLEYLSSRYILALASSTRKVSVIRELTNTGLIKYFKTITTGDMVTHSKPDPQIYLVACENINCKPEECVAIEDSYNGVKSASSGKLHTIMVPDRMPATDEMEKLCMNICSNLKEVQKIL